MSEPDGHLRMRDFGSSAMPFNMPLSNEIQAQLVYTRGPRERFQEHRRRGGDLILTGVPRSAPQIQRSTLPFPKMPNVKAQPPISFPKIPRKAFDEQTRYPRGYPAGVMARRGGAVNLMTQDNVLRDVEIRTPMTPLDMERNAAIAAAQGRFEGLRWRDA